MAMLWTQWPTSASVSGSSQLETRPRLIGSQVSPPSSVRKAPAAEVQAAVKLPPWKMSEFNTQVRRVSAESIVHGLRRMDEVDAAIKSSIGTPRLQLEILVCELTL